MMRYKLPPLSALRAFEAASRTENFAEAGRELGVTHSAISQQIRTIEDWLQVKLFERHGNRVGLSHEGAALRPRINDAFEILAEACAYIQRARRTLSLNVSAEPAFASRWLRPRLVDFRELHPEIEVHLFSGWDQKSPQGTGVDVIIHFEERLKEFVHISDRLFPVYGYPACSPAFREKVTRDSTPFDLNTVPLIHDNSRMMWRRWFNEHMPGSTAWRSGYVYSDLSLAIDAATDGEGMFLADDILCKNEITQGNLIRLMPETMLCTWYCAGVANDRNTNTAVRVFLDWLISASQGRLSPPDEQR
ncbi:LysR family transcriptional regulator [Mesorhizobium sp. NBSH29]|nr:LysR family transcriptional regulator [Mesorhizobium sp. NBSH29]